MARRHDHAKLLRDARRDGVYEQLLLVQEGRCGICRRSPGDIAEETGKPERRLDIDHDHRTMEIRGLLCRGCNMRLRKGMTTAWLYGAWAYMREHS